MTKAEVVERVGQQTGISRQQAYDAVEIFLESIREAIQRGEKVSLVGFGAFFVKEKNARRGRNPRTGQNISIPRKYVPIFKPGKAFREAAANSKNE